MGKKSYTTKKLNVSFHRSPGQRCLRPAVPPLRPGDTPGRGRDPPDTCDCPAPGDTGAAPPRGSRRGRPAGGRDGTNRRAPRPRRRRDPPEGRYPPPTNRRGAPTAPRGSPRGPGPPPLTLRRAGRGRTAGNWPRGTARAAVGLRGGGARGKERGTGTQGAGTRAATLTASRHDGRPGSGLMPARGSAAAGSGGGGAPGGRRGRRRRLLLLVTGRGRGLARGQALRMRGHPAGRRGRAAGVLPPFPPPPPPPWRLRTVAGGLRGAGGGEAHAQCEVWGAHGSVGVGSPSGTRGTPKGGGSGTCHLSEGTSPSLSLPGHHFGVKPVIAPHTRRSWRQGRGPAWACSSSGALRGCQAGSEAGGEVRQRCRV